MGLELFIIDRNNMFNNKLPFLKAPLVFAKRFISNPLSTLFYGLISQWYLVLMTLSVIVLYWVVKGLDQAGVIDKAFYALRNAGKQMKGFAQYCTPRIMDIHDFLDCMNNTPEYTGDEATNLFEQETEKDIEELKKHPVDHNRVNLLSPYDKILDRNTHSQSAEANDSSDAQASSAP